MSNQGAKKITAQVHIARVKKSSGLSIAQLHEAQLPHHLDPFLAFDHFEMAQPFFPPHPHAGFSAVTYMFPDSPNGFMNRDSRGDHTEIPPGSLHWTAAGSGIIHEEVPLARGVVCHGLQIFVNLPSAKKWMDPQILHLDAQDVPQKRSAASLIRVVAGRDGDTVSPLKLPTAVTLLDVLLEPGGILTHEVPEGESRFLYVIRGEVKVGPAEQSVCITQGDAVGFSQSETFVTARALTSPVHFVVPGGRPLREPTVVYGPFCMNTRDDIMRAVRRYEAGQMGQLEASF